jgi:ABC-type long-subunit fatty acid transport system fused permease/ATPase subunit
VLFHLDPELMGIAILAALGGLCISVLVGWPLVGLEVNNQKVEAELRKRLVLLETEASSVHTTGTPFTPFIRVFGQLTRNYRRLYLSFAALGTWLSFYEQVAVLLPYLLVAPRLFAANPAEQLTLGQLVKVSNSFGKVFDSLNVVSDRWLEINEWRSCLRRLREFEREVSSRSPAAPARLVPATMELSDAATHVENGGPPWVARAVRGDEME